MWLLPTRANHACCGTVINPSLVESQVEGAIVYALSSLTSQITIKDSQVQQSNFHDFPLLRISQMPELEIQILNSDVEPSGMGEPGVPPLAPTVCNAIFAATKKRIRTLPIKDIQIS